MSGNVQVLVALVSVLATVAGLSTVSVGALCWFLRQLVVRTIPAMLARQDAMLASHQADRDQHKEAVAALDGRLEQVEETVGELRDHGCGRYAYLPGQRGADK